MEALNKSERENKIGGVLKGRLCNSLVKEVDTFKQDQTLFRIEAMKMESLVTASIHWLVKKIHLNYKTLMRQGDALIELA